MLGDIHIIMKPISIELKKKKKLLLFNNEQTRVFITFL